MSSKQNTPSTFKTIVIVFLLSLLLQIFWFSPLSSPGILELPPGSSTSWNNQLQKVVKLGEGILNKPEDVCIDNEGSLYAATRDGWIKKMHRNGSWEDWKFLPTDSLLGVKLSSTPGYLLVCDAALGLLKVGKDDVTVLASEVNGSTILFADDLVEASDGNVYFSDASTKFRFQEWFLDMLEMRPNARILVYNPSTGETNVVLSDLYFANGVSLSKDREYLVFCETWKYQCKKHFLKGDKKGITEILVENLPGAPDNIKVAPDGTFWIALLDMRLSGMNFVHRSSIAKHLLARFPKLIVRALQTYKKAMVVNVGSDGNIIRKFDDSTGEVVAFVTSVLEFEDHIYLGSLKNNFVGKLPLK
ncbi:hypothetical protein ACHQM5_001640 [Ranunculus cassubicifolius]